MPNEIRTETEIRASPERVWSVLTDFGSYPEWHPSMTITGTPSPGEKLRVRIDAPGLPGMTIQPRVLRSEPAREFAWLGSLGLRGIFDGEHMFELEALGPDRTRFVQREQFSGVLAGAVHARIGESTRAAFEAANEALRQRAEQEAGLTAESES